jgi:hypothetical protein
MKRLNGLDWYEALPDEAKYDLQDGVREIQSLVWEVERLEGVVSDLKKLDVSVVTEENKLLKEEIHNVKHLNDCLERDINSADKVKKQKMISDNSTLKKSNEKLEEEVKKAKRETPKLGRPKNKKVDKFDKWGMLKVKESNPNYLTPDKATFKLDKKTEIKLCDLTGERTLLSLIRIAECGAKDQKRQVKVLPSYNQKIGVELRSCELTGRNTVKHSELGSFKINKEIYKCLENYKQWKGAN